MQGIQWMIPSLKDIITVKQNQNEEKLQLKWLQIKDLSFGWYPAFWYRTDFYEFSNNLFSSFCLYKKLWLWDLGSSEIPERSEISKSSPFWHLNKTGKKIGFLECKNWSCRFNIWPPWRVSREQQNYQSPLWHLNSTGMKFGFLESKSFFTQIILKIDKYE